MKLDKKDELMDGEVKLIGSHAKIDVKTISGGDFCMFLRKEENVKF